MIRLEDLTLAMFDWMIAGTPERAFRLRLPEGGVDSPQTLAIVRWMTRPMLDAGVRGAWAVVDGDEIVGLCSYKNIPAGGEVEIGYGIAPQRRSRGYASGAVRAMLAKAREAGITLVRAETAAANVASSRVLEKNGFARTGTRSDSENGDLFTWSRALGKEGA